MRRLLRWLTNSAMFLSLLLCAATVLLWLRSYWVVDMVPIRAGTRWARLDSANGTALVTFVPYDPNARDQARRTRPARAAHGGREILMVLGPSGAITFGPWKAQVLSSGAWVPVNGYGLIFPYCFAVTLFAFAPACVGLIRRARRKRGEKGLCRKCGYDLRASVGRCPECGHAVQKESPDARSVGPLSAGVEVGK